jgi:hypothetical protein
MSQNSGFINTNEIQYANSGDKVPAPVLKPHNHVIQSRSECQTPKNREDIVENVNNAK